MSLIWYLYSVISLFSIFLLSIASFLTATLSATIGMGGGIVLLSIMTFFLPINVIIPVHGIIQLVSNIFRSYILRAKVVYAIFGYFCLGLPFGAYISVSLIKKLDNPKIALGFIAGLLLYTIFKPKKLPHFNIPHKGFIFVGMMVGILGPLIGATGPFLAIFLIRDDLDKEQLVATKAAVQVAGHIIKIPAFLYLGFDYFNYSPLIISMILVSFFGTKLGIYFLGKVREKQFRTIFKIALFGAVIRILYKIIYI